MTRKKARMMKTFDGDAYTFTVASKSTQRIRKIYRSIFFNKSLVYFANLAMQLDFVETLRIETIACDGNKLYYNSDFVLNSPAEIVRLAICRVVLACALQHHTRRGKRQYNRWQEASRIVTLPLIAQAGEAENTSDVNSSIEQVYERLPEQEGDDNGSPDPDGNGEIMDYGNEDGESTEKDLQIENQRWDEIALQSLALANTQNSYVPDISELIRSRHTTEVNWRSLLNELLTASAKNDYSWAYPNRRFITQNIYLPSLHSTGMPPIVFAIDTSYSMSIEALNAVWDEISIVAETMNPENLVIVHCDARVHKVEKFLPYELPEKIDAVGRFGTDYNETFEYVEKENVNPACLIYLTDLQVWGRENYPEHEPTYPVIWATFNGPAPGQKGVYPPPFGKRVDVVIE